MGLLRLPKMKEIRKAAKNTLEGFEECTDIDIDDIPYLDHQREKQRKMQLEKERAQKEGRAEEEEEEDARKKKENCGTEKKKEKKPEKKLTAHKRRQIETREELDELDDDYRALKKWKKGKISEEEFEEKMDLISRYIKESQKKAVRDLVLNEGIRLDGRKPNELREVKITAGVLDNADGSCYLEWGNNKIYAGVFGPMECHPRHKQKADRAIVQARYTMAPFSVNDRKRPGIDRRSTEISYIVSQAFEKVVMVEEFPKASIRVDMQVVEAHAGTRCAAMTAASVALADAGIPMRDMIPACASGKVNDVVVLDLNKEEDNYGQADLPLAIIPSTGEVVLLQLDGHLTPDQFEEAMDLATSGCMDLYKIMRDALDKSYGGKK